MTPSPSPGPSPALTTPRRATSSRPDLTRMEQRAVDRARFEQLVACDFDQDSEVWRELALEVAEYATGVLVAWALVGKLRSKSLRYPGGGRLPEPLNLDDHTARAVVNEVLVVAL